MEARGDFDASLLDALSACIETDNGHNFMKAALALRAWYRHLALRLKPEMVVRCSADCIEVYGGTAIKRRPNGTLQYIRCGRESDAQLLEVSRAGNILAFIARESIQAEYHAKAVELVERQELTSPVEAEYLGKLSQVNDFVGQDLNVPWWRPKSTMSSDSRAIGKLMWDAGVIDREVYSMALRVSGFGFKATCFNDCALQRVQLAARISEAPNLTPWLYRYHRRVHVWCLETDPNTWKFLRDEFLALGGTSMGWKWLCKQGMSLFRGCDMSHSFAHAVNQVASLQLGRVPFHANFWREVVSWLDGSARGSGKADPRVLDVFKAAMVAYKERKLKFADMGEHVLILDYLMHCPEVVTKGASWSSLSRKQRAWHREFAREQAERRKESNSCLGWAAIIQSLQKGSLEAVSLNNSDDLWEEGTLMGHCVGDYDGACYKNESRIYSIRRNGERVATMELLLESGSWTVRQLYGTGNCTIRDKEVIQFSRTVLNACKKAPFPNASENSVIRAPQAPPVSVPIEEASNDVDFSAARYAGDFPY